MIAFRPEDIKRFLLRLRPWLLNSVYFLNNKRPGQADHRELNECLHVYNMFSVWSRLNPRL